MKWPLTAVSWNWCFGFLYHNICFTFGSRESRRWVRSIGNGEDTQFLILFLARCGCVFYYLVFHLLKNIKWFEPCDTTYIFKFKKSWKFNGKIKSLKIRWKRTLIFEMNVHQLCWNWCYNSFVSVQMNRYEWLLVLKWPRTK